jgi:streptogrisin C
MKMRARWLVVLPATMVLAATFAPPAMADSHAAGVDSHDLVMQTTAEAMAMDLGLVAKANGWTVAQARAQFDTAQRMGRVQEAIAAWMPDAYVGGVLSAQPGGAPSLLLKGAADAFVRDTVAAAGIPVRIIDRQPYSYRELEQRSVKAHRSLLALGYPEVITGVDIESATVQASVTGRPGLPSAGSALAALPADLRSGLDVAVIDGPVGGYETAAFGGQRIRSAAGATCTSGFSVTNGVTTGITGAAHCGAMSTVVHDAVTHALSFQAEHRGARGDVEWYTTAVPEPDDFHADSANIRDVAAVEPVNGITVGESVCFYGRTTNVRNCTTVHATGLTLTFTDGVTVSQLVASTANVSTGGDSGGPWTFNNTAYGVHVGAGTLDGARRSLFTPADIIDEAIGVSVRTT